MKFQGAHHVAFCTNNLKAQIEFFTQVVGMKLVGLFPMHGVEGAAHSFLQAGDNCFLSFIQMKDVDVTPIEPVYGVSHAVDGAQPVAGGALQHLAFTLDSLDEMLDLRDRLRSHGYAVVGPLDHAVTYSMYLGAPEGILLEFVTAENCEPMLPEKWVEQDTATAMGMSRADVQRYIAPPAFKGQRGAVPQPPPETSVYPTPIPRPLFDAIGHLDDAALKQAETFVPERQEAAAS